MLITLKAAALGATAPRLLRCPFCEAIAYSHGINRHRQIADTRLNEIEQRRFRCTKCGRTFQSYPEGIRRCAQRSNRVKGLAVVLYALGLSYRAVSSVMRMTAGKTCASTVYNDVQEAGDFIQTQHRQLRGKSRVMGCDGTGQPMKGGNLGVIFAVDSERQSLITVEVMEEDDEHRVKEFVKRLCREYGVQILITDEHKSYQGLEEEAKVEHRLCETHWKKRKARRIGGLRERAGRRGWTKAGADLEEVAAMIKKWPEIDEEHLRSIWQRYLKYRAPTSGGRWSFGYEVRLAIQDVLENWKRVGPTNNTTEQLIGLLLKMRSKLMRGFQKKENIKKFVYLCAYLWENRTCCDPSVLFN